MINSKPGLGFLICAAALAACGGEAKPAAARQAEPAAGQVGHSSIEEVRNASPGARVVTEGTVSVPSGVIDAGFAIADRQAGIHIAADSTVRMRAGEGVRVRGVLAEIHGLLSIRPDSLERLPSTALPEPRTVRTAAVGEATEGWMVRVQGRAVGAIVNDLPYGWKLRVDDGSGPVQVFFPASGGDFGLERVRVGTTVAVTGFSAQYDTTYEVIPATRADLAITPPAVRQP